MTDMLFYMGIGRRPEEAARAALLQCADVLLANPSLIIELVNMVENADHYEAHIRLMAVDRQEGSATDGRKHASKRKPQPFLKDPRSPEHNISGDPNLWRPVGMEHDVLPAPQQKFDIATHAGYVPEIPHQEIQMLQERGWTPEQIEAFERHNKDEFLKFKLEK